MFFPIWEICVRFTKKWPTLHNSFFTNSSKDWIKMALHVGARMAGRRVQNHSSTVEFKQLKVDLLKEIKCVFFFNSSFSRIVLVFFKWRFWCILLVECLIIKNHINFLLENSWKFKHCGLKYYQAQPINKIHTYVL